MCQYLYHILFSVLNQERRAKKAFCCERMREVYFLIGFLYNSKDCMRQT